MILNFNIVYLSFIYDLLFYIAEMSKSTKKLSSWQDEVNARAPSFAFSSTRLFGSDLKSLEESNGKLPPRVDYKAKYNVVIPSEESEDVTQIKVSRKTKWLSVFSNANVSLLFSTR